MIEVKLSYRPGCVLFYEMHVGDGVYGGGIDKDFKLFVSEDCPYKELMLRALINKCMDTNFPRFTAEDVWGVALEPFGFKREGDIYAASASSLALPSECGAHKK